MTDAHDHERTRLKRLTAFWSSLRCTVVLLMAMAVLCVLGTVIPQQTAGEPPRTGMAADLCARLGLCDLYHSGWLIGLTALLGLNIILCMRGRLRPRRRMRAPGQGGADFSVPLDHQALTERIIRTAPRGLRFRVTQDEGTVLYGEAGGMRPWAVIGMHASILAIFGGMLLGARGIDARLELREGQTAAAAYDRSGAAIPLGFQVRCDGFQVDQYPNGMPKEYVSNLAFIQDGRERLRGDLRVNHPMAFGGLHFYQESYRADPVALLHVTDGTRTRVVQLHEGDVLEWEGVTARVMVVGGNVMNLGPALKLALMTPDGPRSLWIFKEIESIRRQVPDLFERAPSFNPGLLPPYTFTLLRLEPTYVTGIGVKRDPGVPLVAFGGGVFLIGLLIVFLVPHHRVWVRLTDREGATEVRISATRNGRRAEIPAAWTASIREGAP